MTDGGKGGVAPRALAAWGVAGLLLAAALALFWAWGPGRQRLSAGSATAASSPGRPPELLPARGAGELVAREAVSLVSRSSLRVVSLQVDVGDRVVRGQPLVQLEAGELAADLAAARAAWDSTRQAREAAQLTLERALVLRQQTQADGDRADRLSVLSADALAPTELDARRAATRTAALDAQVGQAQLRAAEAAQVQARANWLAARARLAEATLRAPFDGVVTARSCSVGDVVAPGQPCLTVVAPASLRVQARFDESLLSRIRPGDAAQVWLKSQPRVPVAARVVRLNRAVDADTREFSVDLQLASLPPNWAMGERAMVEMQRASAAPAEGGR